MTITEAVRALLLQLTPVSALVATRVYQMKTPQRPTFPLLRLQRVDDLEDLHLRGTSGVRRARIQVDAMVDESTTADPCASANALMAAVHGGGDGTGLCGWSGFVGTPAVEILGIMPAGLREGYDPDELRLYTVSRDYLVTYRA